MKNVWEVWTQGFASDYCDKIVERCQALPPQNATIGFEETNRSNSKYRSSVIRWLDVAGQHADIASALMHFIKQSNRNNFGFDITSMNEIQYTEYHATADGKYDWHNDIFWQNQSPYDRKLSISVQLSEPEEYDGAEFEFFNMESPSDEQWSPRGSALIFPSFLEHRVLPITRGVRRSLVSWIEGPKWR